MKRSLAFISLALVFATMFVLPAAVGKGNAPFKEQALVEIADSVKLMGVFLKGEYLFVHDEERMARGEPCTYVYSGKIERADKLVTSFHCLHVDRDKAERFTMTLDPRRSAYDVIEVREIQFANSTDGHRVPR